MTVQVQYDPDLGLLRMLCEDCGAADATPVRDFGGPLDAFVRSHVARCLEPAGSAACAS